MTKDTKKESAEQSEMELSLEELIRRGARELTQKAIEVELRELLADYENVKILGGQRAVVRNGYLPERQVLSKAPSRPSVRPVSYTHLDVYKRQEQDRETKSRR